MNTKDIVLGKKIMMLLIAKNGTGKTIQTASFRESGPGKIFDFDGRMDSVKSVLPNADIEYDSYGVTDQTDPETKQLRIKSFDRFTKEFFDLTKNCPYKWISVDSITSLSTTVVNYQMTMKGADVKQTKGGIQVPSWDEFNGEAMIISRLLDVAKILPCHVIFTAHPVTTADLAKAAKGEMGATKDSILSFGIKAPGLIPGFFNEIYNMEIEASVNANNPPQRVLHTRSSPGIIAKSTLPLPAKLVLPDGEKGIYQFIQESLKK